MIGTVNFATTCVFVAQIVRMSRFSFISSLQPAVAIVICKGKPSLTVCVNNKCGTLGAVGYCEKFDPALVHRVKMKETDFMDKMGVYDVVPRPDAAEKSFAPDGS